ncbi:LysE family translocator [Motiliproteus sp. MSK22-1]|uniref:LysE family translocator n=1 Tax=Motiliproteus sp. MSK22-1 TaxID=1897630 RepID=UPI000976637F|nr:LysE family translocator [Motiliproteus sp. MSK22-1]OMH33985.1 hypothetical protein BGP75_13560 [Motiliproteus sp. MSK22-1]
MTEFLLVATAHFLALLSPGPDFFLILRTALKHGFASGVSVSFGIAVSNGFYIILALAGFNLMQQNLLLLWALKIGGATYLIYIGYHFIKSSGHAFNEQNEQAPTQEIIYQKVLFKNMLMGFNSGLLNPKNALFYLSLFSLLVSPETSSLQQSFYGVWMFLAVFFWDCLVAASVGNPLSQRWLSRILAPLEKLAGMALVSMGIGLLWAGSR